MRYVSRAVARRLLTVAGVLHAAGLIVELVADLLPRDVEEVDRG